MPIYDVERRLRLRELGYNPDEVDEYSPPQEPKPSAQQQPTVQAPTTSGPGVTGRSFLRGLIPAGGALAAGAQAAELASPAAAIPYVGPFIPPAVGIGTGLLTAMGLKKAQDVVAPSVIPNYAQSEQTDVAEHPNYAALGDTAANLIGMKPSLKAFPGAVRAIGDVLKSNPVAAQDLGNLASIGLGAAVPTGIQIAREGVTKENLPQLAIGAIGGGLLNEPNAIGRNVLRMPAATYREMPLTGIKESQQTGNTLPPEVETQKQLPAPPNRLLLGDGTQGPIIPPGIPMPESPLSRGEYGPTRPTLTDVSQQLQEAPVKKGPLLLRERSDPIPLLDAEPGPEYRNSLPPTQINDRGQQKLLPEKAANVPDESLGRINEQLQQAPVLDEYNKAKAKHAEVVGQIQQETERLKQTTADLQSAMQSNQIQGDNFNPKMNPQRDFTKNLKAPELEAPLTEGEQIQKSFEPGTKYSREPEIPVKPTVEYTEKMSELGKVRGIETETNKRVFDNQGNEVAGAADVRKGLEPAKVRINPNEATIAAQPHEYMHVLRADLKKLGDTRDKLLVAKGDKIIENSDAYKNWVKEREAKGFTDNDVEEYFGSRGSKDVVRRTLETDGNGKFQNWLKDFWSNAKLKLGVANEGDVIRKFSDRLVHDPSFAERFGGKPLEVSGAGKTGKTEESKSSTRFSRESEADIPAPTERSWTWFPSEIDKIRAIDHPESGRLADSFRNFYEKLRANRGEFNNEFDSHAREIAGLDSVTKGVLTSPKEYIQQNTPEMKSALDKMYQEREGSSPKYTTKEAELRNAVKDILTRVNAEMAARPNLPQYRNTDIPHITKNSVLEKIQKNPNSAESVKLKNDFLKYQQSKGIAPQGAQKNLASILSGNDTHSRVESIGIPPSWREDNLLTVMNRHLDRASRRMAYEDTIRSKDIEPLLTGDELGSNKNVKTVLDNIRGVYTEGNPKLTAASGVVRAANLGPLTGIRDFASNLILGMQHQQNPVQTVRSAIDAWKNIRENIADAYKTGVIRHNMNDIEWSPLGNLRRMRDVLSDVQGRNWLEKVTRATALGQGKFITMDFLAQQNKGNLSKAGQKWFEDFGRDIDWKKGTLNSKDLNEIAARYTESVQGTYDYRGLPKIAMDSAYSPMLALARWNIEKANNFSKYVVTPLMNGNVRPFLMSTIGSIIGGAGVVKLTEAITGRKDRTASLDELKAAKEEGYGISKPLLYKAVGIASTAGYTGMVGDIAKSLMDKMYGQNKPRWYNNMLLDGIGNASDKLFATVDAMNKDGFDPKILVEGVNQFLQDNLQTYRLIMNHIGEGKEETEEANKKRDLRTYNTMAGNDISDNTATDFVTDLSGQGVKDFKKEQDPLKAAEQLPDLIQKAVTTAGDNPEKLKKELEKIRSNSYPTMPNPETMPLSFVKYYSYLQKSKGDEEAAKVLTDYVTRNTINKAKSSMVPSL